MKFNRKSLFVLIIPLVIVAIVYPFLPAKIPRQFHFSGPPSYMAKEFIFLVGLLPFVIYKYYQSKRG